MFGFNILELQVTQVCIFFLKLSIHFKINIFFKVLYTFIWIYYVKCLLFQLKFGSIIGKFLGSMNVMRYIFENCVHFLLDLNV